MADDKPDFAKGVALDSISDQPLAGLVDGEPVLLVRNNGRLCAVSGECTHLGAPLETGFVVGGEIRCPWHHARFALDTGEAVGAPAFAPLACYSIEEHDGIARVTDRLHPTPVRTSPTDGGQIVIIGGGAAGYACADMLARAGAGARVTILSADRDPPYDRTFCSKHYLAAEKSRDECAMPTPGQDLGPPPEVRTEVEVASIDIDAREVVTLDGERIGYETLVLATGAEPVIADFAGADHPAVHVLRTLADADRLIDAAGAATTAVVLGASFIGLEVAASLVARKLQVTVVGKEAVPLAPVLGAEIGRFIRALHQEKGVRFLLGRTIESYDGVSATLDDGSKVEADILVIGIGVKPRIDLAKAAGLELAPDEDGVAVDGYLATSAAQVYAIGDIAAYPDPRLGYVIRVEHWVHAQRQGQHLARLLLGETKAPYADTPFFWSTHHDIGIHYLGHTKRPDISRIEGSVEGGDFAVFFKEDGREQALVTLERDIVSLEIEAAWDQSNK